MVPTAGCDFGVVFRSGHGSSSYALCWGDNQFVYRVRLTGSFAISGGVAYAIIPTSIGLHLTDMCQFFQYFFWGAEGSFFLGAAFSSLMHGIDVLGFIFAHELDNIFSQLEIPSIVMSHRNIDSVDSWAHDSVVIVVFERLVDDKLVALVCVKWLVCINV